MDLDLQVVVLAAGLGVRLRPLTSATPKTLLSVGNVSMLRRLLNELQSAGISRVKLVLGKLDPTDVPWLRAATPPGLDLDTVCAPEYSSGTVMSARSALEHNKKTVMVVYGDSLLSVDLGRLIRFHSEIKKSGGAVTILYHRPRDIREPDKDGRTYHGIMSVNPDGLVTRFIEKPKVELIQPGFDLANAAVFLFERDFLDVADFKNAVDFSYNVFEPAVENGPGALYGLSIEDGFRHDIGSLARLYDANMSVLRAEIPATVPGRVVSSGVRCGENTERASAVIIPPVLIGDRVRLGQNSEIGPDAIIGNGCQVGDGAVVRQAVLMDNCVVGANARVQLAILGPHCTVEKDEILSPFTVRAGYTIVGSTAWPEGA